MDIIGQNNILHYLNEGLKRNLLSPSLLFVGPEGTGKRTVAVELAKCFACSSKPGASASTDLPRCGHCDGCRRSGENNHSDLLLIDRVLQATLVKEKPETQTAIKIESIRHLDKFLHLKPMESQRRVAIVDEAHKMTLEAANALLKVLEEPPESAQIILLAVEERGLPPTIRSRCAVLRFRPLSSGHLAEWLEKFHAVSTDKASEVADRAGGSFQKALQLKDEEEQRTMDLSDYELDEFFSLLGEPSWRKAGRKNAETAVTHLIEQAQKKLVKGDFSQVNQLKSMLAARRQIDRNVPPKLVLENLYLMLMEPKR